MRKVITWILIIIGVLWLFGGCDGCNDCSDCSGGCNLVRCDEMDSCEKQYKGKVKLIIHKWDGSEIVVEGTRDSSKKNYIVKYIDDNQTFGTYLPDERVGYRFVGLYYYNENSNSKYILDNGSTTYVNFEQLWRIKDGATVDVYESWNTNVYSVDFVTSTNSNYYTTYSYYIGSNIELSSSIQNVFSSEINDRKQNVGYTAYYTNKNNEPVEFEWTFGGEFNEEIIEHFENMHYTNNGKLKVKQNWVADKVRVEFNYCYGDGLDTQIYPRELAVGYDEDLTKYFTDVVTDENREFFGWYLDEAYEIKAPKEIGKEYETVALKLYAKHLTFKEIKIDLLDGKGPISARVYEFKNGEQPTLSINIPQVAGKIFRGLSNVPQDNGALYYAGIEAGKTYYLSYI
ncbi:MAG: hypothetical protein J6R29_02245 [Clostridia bacterium]|nr:hypothetical protein [Clostridia bacterium]